MQFDKKEMYNPCCLHLYVKQQA